MNLEPFFTPFQPVRSNLVDCLRYWSDVLPEKAAYCLYDGEESEIVWTYKHLDRLARSIAVELSKLDIQGERVLLLYPPGLDFVAGLMGCLYAGAVAVPAYPPRRNRNMNRIQAISDDAAARAALTVHDVRDRVGNMLEEAPTLKKLHWIGTDRLDSSVADEWVAPEISSDQLAVLQYTSGSTGTPKGVMLAHRNIMHNVQLITCGFAPAREGAGFSWLPTYHDMGLVGGILEPLFVGLTSILMSPMSFLQKPARWLRAISEYGVSISGGPNFAYDLCVQKVTDDQIEGLDLSGWEVAYNGAEPVRAKTLDDFVERFSPIGFRRETFYPCYGMAETTLIVTGGKKDELPRVEAFHGKAIDEYKIVPVPADHEHARHLVGCGQVLPDEEVVIADPMKYARLADDRVGEIWVSSASVGQGYWKQEELTEQTFRAKLSNSTGGPYLRTGDLGFIHDGELFVTGRLKDLIIVRGVNRYPQDIEMTVEKASKRLQAGAVGAFAADVSGRERMIVVAEVERTRRKDWGDVIDAIRRNVTSEHELPPDAIILVRFGSIPKTSSGKIQRHACRRCFLDGTLLVVAEWRAWGGESAVGEGSAEAAQTSELRAGEEASLVDAEVVEIVMDHIRAVAKDRAATLTPDSNVAVDLGLDSLERLDIANSLQATFGGWLPVEVVQEIETVKDVAIAIQRHIASRPRIERERKDSQAMLSRKLTAGEMPAAYFQFDQLPEYTQWKARHDQWGATGQLMPSERVFTGTNRETVNLNGQRLINFSSANYLGLGAEGSVIAAAKAAIDEFGNGALSSRVNGGERIVVRQLEELLTESLGVAGTLVFDGRHAAIETTIGHLFGPGDLILYDQLIDSSLSQGAMISDARRRTFPHNDWESLDQILSDVRPEYRRVLIAIEGVSAVNGDSPDLLKFIEIKERHKSFLLLDETHSLGTLGLSGKGICEQAKVEATRIDLRTGSLGTTLGSSGGFVSGCAELMQYLRHTLPGFVNSDGVAPANAAAALAALQLLQAEPERVAQLQSNARLFRQLARQQKLQIDDGNTAPLVAVITESSKNATHLSNQLFDHGINVHPLWRAGDTSIEPRLRFFVTSLHQETQIREVVSTAAKLSAELSNATSVK